MKTIVAGVACLAAVTGGPCAAGVYADDLAKCLVSASTPADREALVRWMFAEASLNPAVAADTNVSPEKRRQYSVAFGKLMDRLLLTDCRKQTVAAIRYEGASTFEASFQTLGVVAGRELMLAPAVAADMQHFADFIDKDGLSALGREAGMPTPAAASGDRPAK